MLSRDEITAAATRIDAAVRTTPTLTVEPAAFGLPVSVTLKLEHHQHTGSFKPRGAFNAILSQPDRPRSVIAASGGNHGLAVAYAARQLGITAEVFVPQTSSPVKVRRLHHLGATVHQVGRHYAEALEASQQRAAICDALVVHAYDQLDVQAGQGTVGLELQQQCPGVDTVLVAVGGGGLIGGVGAWFAGSVQVIAVEPRSIPTLSSAMAEGAPVDVDVSGIAADSLGARRISAATLEVALQTGIRSVLVDDKDIIAARQALWDETRIAVEYGGATALAALMSGAYVPARAERVAVIICGANTDPSDLV